MSNIAHGDRSCQKTCNECLKQEEVQKQALRNRNKADVQVSQDGISAPQVDTNPHVTIYCSECDAAQSIEMNLLWKRGSASHRFVRWACTTEVCSKKKLTLGNWLRFQDDHGSKISKWMKATGIHDDRTRPVHITVKDYMQREELNDRRQTRKRKGERVQIDIESKRKHTRIDK